MAGLSGVLNRFRKEAGLSFAAVAAGDIFREYPGAKGGAGVWQTIINQIPPHEVWIEAFAGSGQVTRRKRTAPAANIVIDAAAAVVAAWQESFPGITSICADALEWLAATRFGVNPSRVVIDCDRPYLRSVRSCQRDADLEDVHQALVGTGDRFEVFPPGELAFVGAVVVEIARPA